MSNSKILFQLSGSISCFKAAQVISTLVQNGHEVKCVATKSALRFIGEATLEGLTGSPVFSDTFESGKMMDHINLARWADTFVLCPATANTINKLSKGIADDVIGQIFLAKGSEKNYLIFPAMNHEMYSHPATQEAISTLTKWGVKVMATDMGHQACGETGLGRLLEPSEIVAHIENKNKALKILVTAGGTREPIDEVRFISNASTGKTSASLADYFLSEGHNVTYLAGLGAATPSRKANVKGFTDFQSLFHLLKSELLKTKYDLVVHAAAVSDYSISKICSNGKQLENSGKLSSEIPQLSLTLRQNRKIISEIKKWSPETCLVAFKLTNGATEKEIKTAVQKLSIESHSDFIVHNDFSQLKSKDTRVFSLFSKFNSKIQPAKTTSTRELAKLLLERSLPHDLSP